MVLFDQRLQVFQTIGKMNANILAVAQDIQSGGKQGLPSLGNHHIQDFHHLLPAGFILFQIAVQRHLQIRRGHQPLLSVLPEEGQNDRINPLIPELRHSRRAAVDHGSLAVCKHIDRGIIAKFQNIRSQIHILDKLLHLIKDNRPDSIIQPDTIRACRIRICCPPLISFQGGKLRNGHALQGFHTGIVVGVIADIAPYAHRFKGPACSYKTFIIRRQRNIILIKQRPVGNKSMYIGTQRQPVDTAILIGKALKIGVVDYTGFGGDGQIHQVVLQRRSIMQRETAAGNDIRELPILIL